MYNTVKYEVEGARLTITMNRPDTYNAFNNEMSYELQDALKNASKDDNIRVVTLTGEGKAFCSGQDLKDVQGAEGRSLGHSVEKRYNPIIKHIRKMGKPVLCRLNGVGAGAGCSLALACDLTIASEKASLIEVFVNAGLVLDSGSSYFLPRLIGYNKAFELATTGRKVKADEAKELGLVNEVVAHDELDQKVEEWAAYYEKAPTKAVGMIKKMLSKSAHSDLETMLQYEAYSQEIAGRTEDYQEGLNAFNEKRTPEFKGK